MGARATAELGVRTEPVGATAGGLPLPVLSCVGALWAGLYRLAVELGWTWDGEVWRDSEGAVVGEGG